MMTLRNSRREAFAVALASGKSIVDAYAAAGFRKHKQNASRLAADKGVIARVSELKTTIAEQVILNKGMVLTGIADIIKAKPKGEPTYHDQLGALGLAVKVLGMDKVEHKLGNGSITIKIYEAEFGI